MVFMFSYERRSCIELDLAWIEMMTVLENLLKNYNIALASNSTFWAARTTLTSVLFDD